MQGSQTEVPDLRGARQYICHLQRITTVAAILIRLLRRLTAAERAALLVGGLLITGMLSAIAVDRLLAQPARPVVVAVDTRMTSPPSTIAVYGERQGAAQ